MFQHRGAKSDTNSVIIVDIDEKSLKELGQWPWPRDTFAKLLQKINKHKPKIIGLDIVFAEPDNSSPCQKRYIEIYSKIVGKPITVPQKYDTDYKLGEIIYQTPTIAGYFFQMSDNKKKSPPPCPQFSLPAQALGKFSNDIFVGYSPVLNIPAIADNALSEGFFNALPSKDGTVRKSQLLIKHNKQIYPSLALEMLREGLKATTIKPIVGNNGIQGITIGKKNIPTDQHAQLWINFRGPAHTFTYYSATDIINNRIPQNALKEKYIIIGTSAWGLRDLRATPFSATIPGAEIHATIIDNILAEDPLLRDDFTRLAMTITCIIIIGLLLNIILAYCSPAIGGISGLFLIFIILLSNYIIFLNTRHLTGVTYSTFTLITIYIIVTLVNYIREGKEKQFIRTAFSHYVSKNVVSEIVKNPHTLRLSGEEKELTIMFSDIKGFTSISETLQPQEVSQFLNEYLTEMTNIILKHNGTLDKYIGDAIMSIWGAPLTDQNAPENAVLAALLQQQAHKQLQQQIWSKRNLPIIETRFGINTGVVRVGNMGTPEQFNYTVIGDQVNIAARLEPLNKVYGTNILITQFTKEKLPEKFLCRMIDKVKVKGKKLPVTIYEPITYQPPTPQTKQELQLYQQAIQTYQNQQFPQTEKLFTQLNQKSPHQLYQLYINRSQQYQQNPPPKNWDGSYTFTHK